jgi:7-cyano-7-deazaguanine synthase in queuosine biosynthesis
MKFIAPTKTSGIWGPEFDALMVDLIKQGKRGARMQTWYCHEDKEFHILVGKVGCGTCSAYERRVGLDTILS